jgi:uncharacterized protein YbjT (DUF2867 family)
MAADDVASAMARVATNSPVNGTIEIGGPEQFRLDELARRDLAARQDPCEVISDPHARYVGIAVSERALVPDNNAQPGEAHFEDWLNLYKTSLEVGFAVGVSAGAVMNGSRCMLLLASLIAGA